MGPPFQPPFPQPKVAVMWACPLPRLLIERPLDQRQSALSMARDTDPDSGRDHFFICVGDQPELDFGGRRNPDGQGFAAFGIVTKGMDVVKKIHESPQEGQSLKPKIKIQRAVRLN